MLRRLKKLGIEKTDPAQLTPEEVCCRAVSLCVCVCVCVHVCMCV
jgi:hypothetical protein